MSPILNPLTQETTVACLWWTDPDGGFTFDTGSSTSFYFSARTPDNVDDACVLNWTIRTEDSNEFWTAQKGATKIDVVPPVITTELFGTNEAYKGDLYVKLQDSYVEVTAEENGLDACQSGIDYCEWTLYRNGGVEDSGTEYGDGESSITWRVDFVQDSNHQLVVDCWDIAGNQADQYTSEYIVDGTPPTTIYDIDGPKHPGTYEGYQVLFLNGISSITLDATDNKFDAEGITTYYKHKYYESSSKWYKCYGDYINAGELAEIESQAGSWWQEYEGEVIGGFEESCNVIYYKSKDLLNNAENVKKVAFFVDKTPPELTKTVGEPKVPMCDVRDFSETGSTTTAISGWGGPIIDVSEAINGYFGWDPLYVTVDTTADGFIEFTVETPRVLDQAPDNFDVVLDLNSDGTPDMLVHWNVLPDAHAPSGEHWSYKEYDGGWSANLALETWMEVTPASGSSDVFTIRMPLAELGLGCGAEFRYGVVAPLADGGYLGGHAGGVAILVFPEENTGDFFGSSDDFSVFNVGALKDWHVKSDTPITLSCTDVGPHPAGGEKVHWTISRTTDGHTWDYVTSDSADVGHQFSFGQTSFHKLEAWCVDAVGKESDVRVQYYKVDDESPVLTKTLVGPHDGPDCLAGTDQLPGHDDMEAKCYLKAGATEIHLSVEDYKEGDAAVHYSGMSYCTWTVEYDGNTEYMSGSFGEGEVERIEFTEDSEHILRVECKDLLGNTMTDVERFLVDGMPPETDKEYGEPQELKQIHDSSYLWITSETPITLVSRDAKVGVDKIYWRAVWYSDDVCEQYPINGRSLDGVYLRNVVATTVDGVSVQEQVTMPDFNEVEGDTVTFTIPESSCHVIEYYAVDKFGHEEPPQVQFVMVDNEAPIGDKVVGEPNIPIDNSCDMPELGGLPSELAVYHEGLYWAWASPCAGGCSNIEPIALPGWRYATADEWENKPDLSAFGSEGSFKCASPYFDPSHNHCDWSDAERGDITSEPTGNHFETWLVFDAEEAPGSCGDFYVTQHTPIDLSCIDTQPHPVGGEVIGFKVYNDGVDITESYCNVNGNGNDVGCGGDVCDAMMSAPEYDLVFDGEYCLVTGPVWVPAEVSGLGFASAYYEFFFKEDSEHVLKWYCEDELGNRKNMADQFYYVETVPPETTLEFLGPHHKDNGVEWIDTESLVKLTAVDPDPHPSGVYKTYYYWEQVHDDYCWGNGYGVEAGDTMEFMVYEEPFDIPEESCHMIAFYSVDNLGNTEEINVEYVFVDKTPPIIEKDYTGPFHVVSDRYSDEYGYGYTMAKYIHPDNTLIHLWAEDAWPHPSGLAKAEYRITQVADEYCVHVEYMRMEKGVEPGDYAEPEPVNVECDAEGEGDWIEFDGYVNVTVGQESCHVIEVRAWDNVEKYSEHTQCVFVDGTAPETDKYVGGNLVGMSPEDIELGSKFFSEEKGFMPALTEGFCGEDLMNCLDITLHTPIVLSCNDPDPHPSGIAGVYFQVHWDGDDVTDMYCDEEDINEDGYCYVEGGHEGFFHFNKLSWHRLDYYCVDNVGNVGGNDVEYFKVDGVDFEIPIHKKWNLVSTPVNLKDNALESLFEGNEDKVVAVWTYHDGEWHVYSPENPTEANSLHTMIPGWGYWILALEDFEVTISGSLLKPGVTPNVKTVYPGWNMIGHYGTNDRESYDGPSGPGGTPISCALNTLSSTILDNVAPSVWTYWEPDNPDVWKPLSQHHDEMHPGAGYWLFYPTQLPPAGYAVSTSCWPGMYG